jgi:hypothetical protein
MQTTFLPLVCKFHLRAKGVALMGHMPVLAEARGKNTGSPEPFHLCPSNRYDELVTPVIGPEGIAVDPGSVCTYIRDRGL